MRYAFLGGTGLKVSELCLGTTAFGGDISAEDAWHIWARCIDAGVNFFDTADASPDSERLLGEMARERRHSLVLSTKVFRPTGTGPNEGGLSRKHIVHACEASLRRLNTDYIDLYLAHSDDFLTPIEETLGAFDQLVRQGKVLYIGGSNYTAWRLNEALWIALTRNYPRYCCMQLLYNLQERDIEVELLPMCKKKSVGVIAWSPLARGVLADGVVRRPNEVRTVVQPQVRAALAQVAAQLSGPMSHVALRWVLSRPGVQAVAVGASSAGQIEENLGMRDLDLAPEHMEILDAVMTVRRPYPALLESLVRSTRSQV
ncbi:aldo/keto reductase [Xanthomonas sacchari]|uniref:aldo/keto reductase n=1 Tax=Xanthomonas sacchari TaxID=56458 RepID=UPI002259D455|nr:aldo/keto reductase [Xanthomonas sacchari]MCW0447195.1 1-deoxyxylulose-5-phosphate synthase YajO [Xanthomonas sacchari]